MEIKLKQNFSRVSCYLVLILSNANDKTVWY